MPTVFAISITQAQAVVRPRDNKGVGFKIHSILDQKLTVGQFCAVQSNECLDDSGILGECESGKVCHLHILNML